MARENEVTRLLGLLEELKATKAGNQAQAWAEVFGIEAGNTSQLFYLLSETLKLVHEAREVGLRAAEAQGYDANLVESSFNKVEAMLRKHLNLKAGADAVRSEVTPELTVGLAHIAELVGTATAFEEIPEDDLATLRGEVIDLLSSLEELDVEGPLAALVRDHLLSILSAVDHYQIRGLRGLREAMEMSFGSVARNAEELKDSSDKVVRVTTRFMGILLVIDRLVSIAENAKPMLAAVSQYFLPEGVTPELPE